MLEKRSTPTLGLSRPPSLSTRQTMYRVRATTTNLRELSKGNPTQTLRAMMLLTQRWIKIDLDASSAEALPTISSHRQRLMMI